MTTCGFVLILTPALLCVGLVITVVTLVLGVDAQKPGTSRDRHLEVSRSTPPPTHIGGFHLLKN